LPQRQRHPGAELRAILSLGLVAFVMMGGLRVFLAAIHRGALSELATAQIWELFFVGARLDAAGIARLLYLPLIGMLVPGRIGVRFVQTSVLVLTILLAFELVFEVVFVQYYGVRPNYLIFEHGADPEVLRTSAHYVTPLALAAVAALISASLLAQGYLRRGLATLPLPLLPGGPLLARLALVAFSIYSIETVARGTLDHRPINPSIAFVSSNRVANEIASSGLFTIEYEAVRLLHGDSVRLAQYHAPLEEAEAERRLRDLLRRTGRFTNDSPNPYVRLVTAPAAERRRNVVVVVMESFTGRLVGALGGSPALSPELDALSEEGLLWENCYATGERTVQGLEAVLSSFPPLPGVSVVRRSRARGNFETLASVLGRRGYESLFLYGGQGLFDHMSGFFRSNGFGAFLEEADFGSVSFRGTWGVSDEDVFRRANAEFQARWEAGRPFLGTILTVSLHSPWEFPAGRSPPLPEDTTVPRGFERDELENFLYADFAVGEFMREARKLDYSRDTLFVFVGDHGVHLRGRELLPSEEYRVPLLFVGPGWLPPGRIHSVASQIDIAPTIMGLLGGDYRSAFFGRDLLASDEDGLAILVYHKRDYGVRKRDRLTVLAAGEEPRAYAARSRWTTTPVTVTEPHTEDARDAMAVVQTAEALLERQLYTTRPLDEAR